MVAGGGVPLLPSQVVACWCRHFVMQLALLTGPWVVAWCDALAMVAGGFLTPWVVVGGVLVRPFKVAVHKTRVF
jgi:hypothetical protein